VLQREPFGDIEICRSLQSAQPPEAAMVADAPLQSALGVRENQQTS